MATVRLHRLTRLSQHIISDARGPRSTIHTSRPTRRTMNPLSAHHASASLPARCLTTTRNGFPPRAMGSPDSACSAALATRYEARAWCASDWNRLETSAVCMLGVHELQRVVPEPFDAVSRAGRWRGGDGWRRRASASLYHLPSPLLPPTSSDFTSSTSVPQNCPIPSIPYHSLDPVRAHRPSTPPRRSHSSHL